MAPRRYMVLRTILTTTMIQVFVAEIIAIQGQPTNVCFVLFDTANYQDIRCFFCVNVNVNNLLAISIWDFDNSGQPRQAKGVNHLETPLRQLHVTHRAFSCARRGGHVQLCLKPSGARGIEPETFRRRGLLLRRLDQCGFFVV